MFRKLKMKFAARKIKRQKDFAATDKRIRRKYSKFKRALLRPFIMIGRAFRWVYDALYAICSWIWAGVCKMNFVATLNSVFLITIIVLFAILIKNTVSCNKKPIVISQTKNIIIQSAKQTNNIVNAEPKLPIRRNAVTGRLPYVINVIKTTPSKNPALRPQGDGKIYGDTIIETRNEAVVLKNGAHINGNLYLQRMHKYVLPCGVKIEGNLFLRDVHMLEFCGEFTVKGNIYVSPKSSFGPLPRNARIGGQVIL